MLMGSLALAAVGAQAQFNSYNPNDLFLVFRKDGANKDLVVNVGSISLYNKMDGASFTISQYTGSQLNNAFANLNDVYWGAWGWNPSSTADGIADRTLWATRARADINVAATPFDRASAATQQNAITEMKARNDNAKGYGINNPADSVTNTASAVLIPNSDPEAVTTYVNGSTGQLDFNGRLTDTVENKTSATFSSGGTARSDLFEMTPNSGGGAGTALGKFTLNSDGTLQYQAVPEPGTYALFGLGALGMYLFRRARK